MKVELPAELHGIASTPAMPCSPSVLVIGRKPISAEPIVQTFGPWGGHALLDLYFASVFPSFGLEAIKGKRLLSMDDAAMDELTKLAWRLAVSAVRTRPDTSAVPAGIPKEGL